MINDGVDGEVALLIELRRLNVNTSCSEGDKTKKIIQIEMSRQANTKDVAEMIKTAFKVPKALDNRKVRLFYKPKVENQKPQPCEISETITLNSSGYSSHDVI